MQNKKRKKLFLVFLAVLGLAAFLRFWALDQFPPGLYPDEAVNATDGLQAAEAGRWGWFYPNNNGREGLFNSLEGWNLKLRGISLEHFRQLPALIGFLTVGLVLLLGWEMASWRAGIFSALLLAASYWHLNFSRIGFRAILVPLILAGAFYLLFRAYHQIKEGALRGFGAPGIFLAAGLVFGIGMHTYIAFRISPAIVLVFFFLAAWNFWKDKKRLKKLIQGLLLFSLGAFLTALPLLLYFWQNPESLAARQNDNSISVMDPNNNHGDLVGTLLMTGGQTLGQFFFKGDQNWRHNLPTRALLNPVEALFFGLSLIAFCLIFIRLKIERLLGKRKPPVKQCCLQKMQPFLIEDKDDFFLVAGTLLAWFVIMLAPAFMTVEGLPHALRSIGSVVPVYLMLGILVGALWDKAEKVTQKPKDAFHNFLGKTLIRLGITLLLILSVWINTRDYFVIWGRSVEAAHAFERRLVNIGEYLGQLPLDQASYPVYLIVNQEAKKTDTGYPVTLETIRFFAWKWDREGKIAYILPEEIKGSLKINGQGIVLMQKQDQGLIEELKSNYALEAKTINFTPYWAGTEFEVLQAPALKPKI